MPWSTFATSGAVAWMRSLISSRPSCTKRSWQGVPSFAVALAHSSAMLEKPMSLPPIWSVTMFVVALRRSNCGGLGPSGETPWGFAMSSVSAPLQLASFSVSPRFRAVRFA